VGTQYRSIILYQNEAQKVAAEKSKAEAQKKFTDTIVTQIVPLKKFYKAEDYHQNYYNENSNEGYCQIVIKPKVDKLEKKLKAEKQK
jgi:peptide-methionine (S)-S-oxide reductase